MLGMKPVVFRNKGGNIWNKKLMSSNQTVRTKISESNIEA